MTHNDLIKFAAKKLEQKHALVITEMASSAGEQPDALGFQGRYTTLIECKASRSDFLADAKKFFRRIPERGMGAYRYYMTPSGLITAEELPFQWGLFEIKGQRIYQKVKASYFSERAINAELALLLSVIRRIGQTAPTGISVRCYTYLTGCRAMVGFGTEERTNDNECTNHKINLG
jgi:hypothetical protein